MEIFALNDVVARLEAELTSAQGVDRMALLLALAWHLRQRNTRRALDVAGELEGMLVSAILPAVERSSVEGRITLIRAEAEWLFARLAEAELLARRALELFAWLNDQVGCADAHWLLAWIAVDGGKLDVSDAEFEASNRAAVAASDLTRAGIAQAAMVRWAVLRNLRLAD